MPRVSKIWPGQIDVLDAVVDDGARRASIVWPTLAGQLDRRCASATLLGFFVGLADADALEVLGERALRLADAHAVVVEDDEQLALERAGAVEAFERQAVDDRGVADDGDDVVVALEHADRRGPCRRRC